MESVEIIIAFIGGMMLGAAGIGIFHSVFNRLASHLAGSTSYPWHSYNDSPEERTYVLAYINGRYVVMFYRDSMYEFPDKYVCTSVDRWMYIHGNTQKKEEKQ